MCLLPPLPQHLSNETSQSLPALLCRGLLSLCLSQTGPAELLEAWLAQFNLEEKKGEIAELLATSPSIRALYTKMVRPCLGNS